MAQCLQCGYNQVRPGAKYCPVCRAAQPVASVAPPPVASPPAQVQPASRVRCNKLRLEQEQPGDNGNMQFFEHGFAIRVHGGRIFVFYNDKTWDTDL